MANILHAAARDASVLRSAPASLDSLLILAREGETLLARNVIQAETDYIASSRIVAFLSNERPSRQIDPAAFDFAEMEEQAGDAALEAMIDRAQADQDEAGIRLTAAVRQVSAIAQDILDRNPGAEFADLGIS